MAKCGQPSLEPQAEAGSIFQASTQSLLVMGDSGSRATCFKLSCRAEAEKERIKRVFGRHTKNVVKTVVVRGSRSQGEHIL